MSLRRQSLIWAGLACATLVLLAWFANRHNRSAQRQLAIAVEAHPMQGAELFRAKGCASCHDGGAAPDLRQRASLASLPQLVTAMWNHAPRMWQAMQARGLNYPTLTYDEAGQIVSYLYLSGWTDQPGDAARGRELFSTKRCSECHGTVSEVKGAPALPQLAQVNTPLAWTEILWNHAAGMQSRMRQKDISWPRLEANDLRDLFAYLQQASGGVNSPPPVLSGDPERGWQVFQAKGCIRCHALTADAGGAAPNLGPTGKLPPSFAQFGEAMLNHFPQMQRVMESQHTQPPRFDNQEFADLAVFIYSLHYLEPSGSPQVGKSVFSWRSCGHCHGSDAEGGSRGPALRGRGRTYTAVRLASDLWQHGATMYQENRQVGQSWPTLEQSDVGNLLAFLNTPIEH